MEKQKPRGNPNSTINANMHFGFNNFHIVWSHELANHDILSVRDCLECDKNDECSCHRRQETTICCFCFFFFLAMKRNSPESCESAILLCRKLDPAVVVMCTSSIDMNRTKTTNDNFTLWSHSLSAIRPSAHIVREISVVRRENVENERTENHQRRQQIQP